MSQQNNQSENKTKILSGYDIKKSAHPGLITWDIILKGTPIAFYFLAFLFPNSLVIRLTTITLISAMDFWFTKNISGRILAGLKWSRVVEDNGHEYILYETKRDESTNHPVDLKFFWGLMGLAFAIWLILFFFNLLSLSNLMIIIVPLSLIGFNLYSFYNCSKSQQEKVNNFILKNKEKATNHAINHGIQHGMNNL